MRGAEFCRDLLRPWERSRSETESIFYLQSSIRFPMAPSSLRPKADGHILGLVPTRTNPSNLDQKTKDRSMKRNLLLSAFALVAGSLIAADASPKDDVTAAAKSLADKGNYSWKSTTDLGANAQFTPGPTEGKSADGLVWLSLSFGDNTTEGVAKGTKVAVKTEEGWQSAEELTGGGGGGGGFNPGTMIARRMQTLKAPAAEITDLLAGAKDITKQGDTYSADLTEEGAKNLSAMGFGGGRGGRGGRGAPPVSDAKGSVKFWLKDGMVSKYELKTPANAPIATAKCRNSNARRPLKSRMSARRKSTCPTTRRRSSPDLPYEPGGANHSHPVFLTADAKPDLSNTGNGVGFRTF